MKNYLENTLLFFIAIAILLITYAFGYGMSERAHCIANKGHYSFDYGECVK